MNMTVKELCTRALQLAGRADKVTTDDYNMSIVTLNTLLNAWRARGVDLFNLQDIPQNVSLADYVLNDGSTYICIRDHYSTAADEPGAGANWENYWVLTTSVTSTTAWAAATNYVTPRKFDIDGTATVAAVANVRVIQTGLIYPVELIGDHDFFKLDPVTLGIPTKMFLAPTSTGGVEAWVHPTPDHSDLVMNFTLVQYPADLHTYSDVGLPPKWFQALQYGLAAELAFYFVLSAERITMLSNKAEIEFQRAKDKGGTETCYVKPLF